MEALSVLLGALTALCVAVTALLPVLRSLRHADAATDGRLDQLWETHVRRGRLEATRKDLVVEIPEGERDMAVFLRPEVRAAYEPIALALRALRAALPDATPGQFAEAVETKFGPWLYRHICQVLGVSDYACLDMARLVAEGKVLSDEYPGPA